MFFKGQLTNKEQTLLKAKILIRQTLVDINTSLSSSSSSSSFQLAFVFWVGFCQYQDLSFLSSFYYPLCPAVLMQLTASFWGPERQSGAEMV